MKNRSVVAFVLLVIAVLMVGTSAYFLAKEYVSNPDGNTLTSVDPNEIVYSIKATEDMSYSSVIRKLVRVAIEPNPSTQQIEWLSQDVVQNITSLQSVNAITIAIYYEGDDYYNTARIVTDWAPYGKWDRADEVTAGDYSLHQYEYIFTSLYNS